MLLVDTHVWVDFFSDSARADEVKSIILGKPLFTSVLSLAEFKLWALRNNVDATKHIAFICENSALLYPDKDIALIAGQLKFVSKNRDLGLIDCLICATAIANGLDVISGDPDFKEFKNAIVI